MLTPGFRALSYQAAASRPREPVESFAAKPDPRGPRNRFRVALSTPSRAPPSHCITGGDYKNGNYFVGKGRDYVN